MNRRINMRYCFALMLSVVACFLGSSLSRSAAAADTPPPTVIRITPPAPVLDETKRLEELATRRKQVADAIGPKAMLVLFSAEPRVYTNDVDFPFRQENNLFYLTNLNQKRATLVLMPGNSATPEILFLPRRNPAAETWTGHMYSAEEARAASGVQEVWEAKEFEPFMNAVRSRLSYRPAPQAVLLAPADARPAPSEEFLAAMSKNE